MRRDLRGRHVEALEAQADRADRADRAEGKALLVVARRRWMGPIEDAQAAGTEEEVAQRTARPTASRAVSSRPLVAASETGESRTFVSESSDSPEVEGISAQFVVTVRRRHRDRQVPRRSRLWILEDQSHFPSPSRSKRSVRRVASRRGISFDG